MKFNRNLLIPLFLLILITALYFDKKFAKTTAPQKQTILSSCEFKDKNFCEFFRRMKDYKKYYPGGLRITIESRGSDGTNTKSIWETDGKTRGRVLTYTNGNTSSESILINKDFYTKDISHDFWNKESLANLNMVEFDVDIENIKKFVIEKIINKISGAKITFIGKEDCGERNCLKYQLFTPSLATSYELIYVDAKDFTLIKTHSEAKDGYSEDSTLEKTTVTIQVPSTVH